MGKVTNLGFAAYLLRKNPRGLTRNEFYMAAEKVGWINGDERMEWVAKYMDSLFMGGGQKELIFFFDGQKLRIERKDIYPVGFSPIDIHNTITQRSPQTLNQIRERGKIYTFLDLMVAIGTEYENETGQTLYQLALQQHRQNRSTPAPRNPQDSSDTKYYEIEVDVNIGRIVHDIPRGERIVARMIRETRERIQRYEPGGEFVIAAEAELESWEAIYHKIEGAIEVLEGDNPRRQILELTSLNGPPINGALEKALREVIAELATTDEEDKMLAKLGLKGIKVDTSGSTAELKGVVNLTKRWLEEEMRLFGGSY